MHPAGFLAGRGRVTRTLRPESKAAPYYFVEWAKSTVGNILTGKNWAPRIPRRSAPPLPNKDG